MRDIWPFGVFALLIVSACLALGADSATGALTFSCLLMAAGAVFVLGRRPRIGLWVWGWIAGAAALAGLGAFKGWMSVGAPEYASLIAGAGVYIVAQEGARSTERADRMWRLMLVLGAGIGFAAFVDFIADPHTIFGYARRYHVNRLSAPFLSANTAATFYGVIALMALTSCLRALRQCQGRRPDVYARVLVLPVAALAITVTCLFLTGSRAGISLFVLCAAGLAFWRSAEDWRKGGHVSSLATPLLVVVTVLAMFWISGGVYAARLANDDAQFVDNIRMQQFASYWAAVWRAPFVGQGLGGFPFMARLYEVIETTRGSMTPKAAHNLVLQWLVQAGLIGTLGGAAVLSGLVNSVRHGLNRRRRQKDLIRGVLVVIVFVLAHAMLDYALEITGFFWLFCWLIGLGGGLANRSRSALRPLSWRVSGVLAAGLVLASVAAGFGARDRLIAEGVRSLSDAHFLAIYRASPATSGSAARFEAIGDRALRLNEPDFALAYWAFSEALDIEPRDGEVWGKRAYSGHFAFSRMTEASIEDLRRSYALLPYGGQSYLRWRSAFVLSIWEDLPEDVRAAAQRESRALPRQVRQRWEAAINDADA